MASISLSQAILAACILSIGTTATVDVAWRDAVTPSPIGAAIAQASLPADANEAANTLFVEALQIIANTSQENDNLALLNNFQRAQILFDRIVSDYPSSQISVQLMTRQRVGTFDPEEFHNQLQLAQELWCNENEDVCFFIYSARDMAADLADLDRRLSAFLWIAWRETRIGLREGARLTYRKAIVAANESTLRYPRINRLLGIARAQMRNGYREDAELTLNNIVAIARQIEETEYRSTAMRSIAETQFQLGFEDAGLTIALEIIDDRERLLTLNEIANVQINQDRYLDAKVTANAYQRLSDRARVLGNIAVAQAQTEQFSDAFVTVREIREISDDVRRELYEIASAQAEAGFFDASLMTMNSVIDQQITGLFYSGLSDYRSRGFRDIAVSQANSGLIEDSLVVAAMINVDHHLVSAWREIARAQALAGFEDDARILFDDAIRKIFEIPNEYRSSFEFGPYQRWRPLAEVASAQVEAGFLEEARQTFAEAVNLAKTVTAVGDLDRRASALRSIAARQAEAGLTTDAMTTLSWIADEHSRSWALHDIATERLEEGAITDALLMAREIMGTEIRAEILHDIARVQIRAAPIEEAWDLLAEATQTVMQINENDDRDMLLREIASAYSSVGFFIDARNTAYEISDQNEQFDTLSSIAIDQAEAGRMEYAFSIASSISIGHIRSQTFSGIAFALAEAGYVDVARRVFTDAVAVAREVESDRRRDEALFQVMIDMSDAAVFVSQ